MTARGIPSAACPVHGVCCPGEWRREGVGGARRYPLPWSWLEVTPYPGPGQGRGEGYPVLGPDCGTHIPSPPRARTRTGIPLCSLPPGKDLEPETKEETWDQRPWVPPNPLSRVDKLKTLPSPIFHKRAVTIRSN